MHTNGYGGDSVCVVFCSYSFNKSWTDQYFILTMDQIAMFNVSLVVTKGDKRSGPISKNVFISHFVAFTPTSFGPFKTNPERLVRRSGSFGLV